MKAKRFFSLSVIAIVISLVSCDKGDDQNFASQNLETRAATLGFSDVNTYNAYVAEQCRAGIHENCDVLNNGTHQACAYSEHVGTKHDGTHHNGTEHGTHDKNGHLHSSHGNHNSGNHGGNHH